jgi:hypothetical protein
MSSLLALIYDGVVRSSLGIGEEIGNRLLKGRILSARKTSIILRFTAVNDYLALAASSGKCQRSLWNASL